MASSPESAAQACLHGNAAMQLEAARERPHLRHRRDVDPDALVLADDQEAGTPAPAGSRPPVYVVSQSPTAGAAAAAVAAPAAVGRPSDDGTDLIAPLVLLQLSDLHFGPHGRFAETNLERLAAQCRQAILGGIMVSILGEILVDIWGGILVGVLAAPSPRSARPGRLRSHSSRPARSSDARRLARRWLTARCPMGCR